MAISRRRLFGLFASLPVVGPAIARDALQTNALDARMANIKAMMVDPPLMAVPKEIPVNLYAGAITWVDADYDERTGEVLLSDHRSP